MRTKWIALLLALAMVCALLTGCGGSETYVDGTYTGRSSEYINEEDDSEDGNGYGVVTLTISGGVITECTYQTFELDGTLKDEEYGKQNGEIANRDFYNKAQKANAACAEYAKQLVETGSLKDVDAISGATINYNEFQEAVRDALKQAKG